MPPDNWRMPRGREPTGLTLGSACSQVDVARVIWESLSLLRSPFLLRQLMLQPAMGPLLSHDVGAGLAPPDLRTWARSRAALQLEVLALRHQLRVLQRSKAAAGAAREGGPLALKDANGFCTRTSPARWKTVARSPAWLPLIVPHELFQVFHEIVAVAFSHIFLRC
jgi:hypothetical protein